MAETKELSIDFLDDLNLESFEDLQGFEPFHPGTHRVIINWTAKEINGNKNFIPTLKLVETVELKDPSLTPDAPGKECSTVFNVDNETGRGFFKQLMMVPAEKYGTTKISQLLEQMQGNEVLVVTGIRPDKDDPDKKYLQLKSLTYEA